MNVIIAGGRDFDDYQMLVDKCDNLLISFSVITIVSGGASGADALGERYSIEERNKKPVIFKADWKKYGRMAGPIRNKQMADNASMLIAFWDGKSRGTKNMISTAEENGLVVHVFKY